MEDINFISIIHNRDIDLLNEVLVDGKADPSINNNYPFTWACTNGFKEGVISLLKDKRVDPSSEYNIAIKRACSHDHFDIVKILLDDGRANPYDLANTCLYDACVNNNHKVVELLLEDDRIDPSGNQNMCLFVAIQKKHIKIAKLLIKTKEFDLTLIVNMVLHTNSLELIDSINEEDPNLIKQYLNNITEHSLLAIFLSIMKDCLVKLLEEEIISEETVARTYAEIGNGNLSPVCESEALDVIKEIKRKKRDKIIDDLI